MDEGNFLVDIRDKNSDNPQCPSLQPELRIPGSCSAKMDATGQKESMIQHQSMAEHLEVQWCTTSGGCIARLQKPDTYRQCPRAIEAKVDLLRKTRVFQTIMFLFTFLFYSIQATSLLVGWHPYVRWVFSLPSWLTHISVIHRYSKTNVLC